MGRMLNPTVYRMPRPRVTVRDLAPLDQVFYKALKIIKDRCPARGSTVFDPVLTAGQAASRVRTLLRIEKDIFKGKYTEKPWRFIEHVNEAFNHILTTKTKKCKIHMETLKFKEVFDSQMDEVMQELGYCCGTWHILKARRVICGGTKDCIVPADEVYFRYCEWTYCLKCFNNAPGDVINVETIFGNKTIDKELFQPFFFYLPQPEPFVRCQNCGLQFHKVCVMYCLFNNETFFCDKCRTAAGIPAISLRASRLPKTECDMFINCFLQSHDINLDENITIRLMSERNQSLEVPEKLQKVRPGPSTIESRNYTLFTFFDTGANTDICFFSVFFQLFDEKCQECNRNTVYLSFIDSINLLPCTNRTLTYRLILLGLFQFLKGKGYKKIYLWSCPPSGDNDYIFYMKPPKMKMPTATRLASWYKELFATGVALGVIDSYNGIKESATDVNGLPYMEGDLWIARLNEAVDTVNKEHAKDYQEMKKLKSKLAVQTIPNKILEIRERLEKLQMKNFKAVDKKLWDLLNVQIQGFNREYFVIHLKSARESVDRSNLIDDKLSKSNSWLNDRHLFMDFFWGNRLEFSSERRAQYSTFVMLWRIFVENGICAKCSARSIQVTGQVLCSRCQGSHSRCSII